MSERKKRVRVGFIDEPTVGIGPEGRGVDIAPGAYRIAELDGVDENYPMVFDQGRLLAMIPASDFAEVREVLDGPFPVEWATYYREHPHVLASWGEQNGRKP